MKKNLYILLLCVFVSLFKFTISNAQKMVICVPVADLRLAMQETPQNLTLPILSKDNNQQDTQLLYNEQVMLLSAEDLVVPEDEEGPIWLRVECIEQKKYFPERKVHHHIGFIKSDQAIIVDQFPANNAVVKEQFTFIHRQPNEQSEILDPISIGTKLLCSKLTSEWHKVILPTTDGNKIGFIKSEAINNLKQVRQLSKNQLRTEIIKTACSFIGKIANTNLKKSYCWGGRSGYIPGLMSGVDCSALINLIYRAVGIDIARDTYDQFRLSTLIPHGSLLQPGDLIFFARNLQFPEKVGHIVIYLGEGQIIESTGFNEEKLNRIINDTQLLDKRIEEFESGQQTKHGIIYFGSYLR